MNKFKVGQPLFHGILSGVLIGFSYIPFSSVLSFFAIIPLFLFWKCSNSKKEIILSAFLAQFILTLIGFHWVAHTAIQFGQLPWPLGILSLLAFCCVSSLHFVLAAYFYFKVKNFLKNTMSHFIAMAAILYLFEFYLPKIFDWNFGYTFYYNGLPIAQTAEWIGFTGLSFLVMITNSLFANYIHCNPHRSIKTLIKTKSAILPILVVLALNLVGYFIKPKVLGDKKLNALIIQANIGNFEKIEAEVGGGRIVTEIVKRYVRQTTEYIESHPEEKIDLIVWPETAIPIPMDERNKYHPQYQQVQSMVRKLQIPLLSGSYLKDRFPYNAIILFNKDGQIVNRYKKHILLAFGEYIPIIEKFPDLVDLVDRLVPAISFFGRGEGATVMPFKDLYMAPNSCYEGLDPNYVNTSIKKGANLITNLTNDSWFGTTFEPYQHMYMTFARSIEFRIPVLRATNTGITSMARLDGSLLDFSPLHEKWEKVYSLDYFSSPQKRTIYSYLASFLPILLFVLSIVTCLLIDRRFAKKVP